MMGFSEGNVRVLVTKPKIAGHGMNWQHCSNMAFVGLSDSWEAYYQAIRRCWRFGQTKPVKVHVIVANTEGAVVSNLMRKEKEAEEMMARLVQHMNSEYTHQKDDKRYVGTEKVEIPTFLKKGNK
jgi:SNF2 family DNA or RNA helicase